MYMYVPNFQNKKERIFLFLSKYFYCIYKYEKEEGAADKEGENYYAYGVTTFIYIDLPIAGQFKIPVYTKGKRIYKFTPELSSENV